MEKEFEKANEKLQKLKIKDGNINTYIAHFIQLAHQKGHNVNELTILIMFS